MITFTAEGASDNNTDASAKEIDAEALRSKTITLYTHGGNRVLGEEKKDADGNTYISAEYCLPKTKNSLSGCFS